MAMVPSIFDGEKMRDWLWREHGTRDEDRAVVIIGRAVVRGFREFDADVEDAEAAIWTRIEEVLVKAKLSGAVKSGLRERFSLTTRLEVETREAAAGDATKSVVTLGDSERVECVTMRHTETGRPRTTVCVSSQAGCAMGCRFCATGTMGLRRNLTSAEIVEQFALATMTERKAGRSTPTNVVFMGMGEPLANYEAVTQAIDSLGAHWDVRRKATTVSTVGVAPSMRRLTREYPEVSQALSLHAPNQAIRERIVPAAKNWRFDELLACVDEYLASTRRRHSSTAGGVMIEYVLIAGVNDADAHADELASHFVGKAVMINLIPYNANVTADANGFKAPTRQQALAFGKRVIDKGIKVRLRKEFGADIAAACGQLALVDPSRAKNGGSSKVVATDIEDIVAGGRSTAKQKKHHRTSSSLGGSSGPAGAQASRQERRRLSAPLAPAHQGKKTNTFNSYFSLVVALVVVAVTTTILYA